MPRIVALFACSVVCVAASLPACAEDRGGVVSAVDAGDGVLHLADGTTYALPVDLDVAALRPGMEVHLLVSRETPVRPQIQL